MTTQTESKIPMPVIDGVTAMLKPYGVDFPAMLELQREESRPAMRSLEKRYLTTSEATEYCGIKRWSLWKAERDGKITAMKPAAGSRGGRVLYDRESIDRWLTSCIKLPRCKQVEE